MNDRIHVGCSAGELIVSLLPESLPHNSKIPSGTRAMRFGQVLSFLPVASSLGWVYGLKVYTGTQELLYFWIRD